MRLRRGRGSGVGGQRLRTKSRPRPPDPRPPTPDNANITLRGHVLLQDRSAPPNPDWSVFVTGTLRLPNGTCFAYNAITDNSGYFTVTAELPAGDYQWRIKESKTLAN